MEIPLNAQVECKDGTFGRTAYLLINPIAEEVTHLVVRKNSAPQTEYIVPLDQVEETIAGIVQLRCTKKELEKMDLFVKTRYIEKRVAIDHYANSGMYGNAYYMPFVIPSMTISVPEYDLQIPPGEMAEHRGTRVEAVDGFIGKIDEFVVNPENCHITHLVIREGHLWGIKEAIIPISAIDRHDENTVHLKLTKNQVGNLPTFPIQRRHA